MREIDSESVVAITEITELLATVGRRALTETEEAIAGDIVAVAGILEFATVDRGRSRTGRPSTGRGFPVATAGGVVCGFRGAP